MQFYLIFRGIHTGVKQSHSTLVRFVILRQMSDSSEQLFKSDNEKIKTVQNIGTCNSHK